MLMIFFVITITLILDLELVALSIFLCQITPHSTIGGISFALQICQRRALNVDEYTRIEGNSLWDKQNDPCLNDEQEEWHLFEQNFPCYHVWRFF